MQARSARYEEEADRISISRILIMIGIPDSLHRFNSTLDTVEEILVNWKVDRRKVILFGKSGQFGDMGGPRWSSTCPVETPEGGQ